MSDKHDGHGHSHAATDFYNVTRAFYIGIGLNAIFTLIEFIVGYSSNSLSLIADASHNLSDVASLIISLMGMKLAQKAATALYTYGFKKASILASLINSVLLVAIVIHIFKEGVERLSSPIEVAGNVIIITALVGVLINTISAFLFYKGQKNDINVKGAFLHLLVDAVVSVGVVISGIIIHYTGWNIMDPIISFVIASVILISTWGLLRESITLSLNGVPQNIDPNKIKELLSMNSCIKGVHHLHIWALSSSENAMTVHIILNREFNLNEIMDIKREIKHDLKDENIQHVTIEIDKTSSECEDRH